MGALADTAATDVLLMLRDRSRFHLAHGCRYAQAFVNQGKNAGASIEHPHAQLVALDLVPPRVQVRLDRFAPHRFVNIAETAPPCFRRSCRRDEWCGQRQHDRAYE